MNTKTVRDGVSGSRPTRRSVRSSFARFAGDIKLAHSVFALPFAASAFPVAGIPSPSVWQVVWLLVAMVSARSFAMGMNRYLDREVDRRNPRTAGRKIPSGHLSPREGLAWSLVWGAGLVIAAFALNPLAGYCSFPLLLILAAYSLTKKVTWICHAYLGMCLGLSPVAVSVAMTGNIPPSLWALAGAIMVWTAGFDILYALQDMKFDRDEGLHSVPVRFGPVGALWVSRLCFVVAVALLAFAGVLAGAGVLYAVGVGIVGGILTYEHYLVRDAKRDGQSRNIGAAFFNVNAFVSVTFFLFASLDALLL